MATETLYLRSAASFQCVAAGMHILYTVAGSANTTTCSIKRAKTIASWQFIPGTSSNITTISDPPSTTPATKGWLYDNQQAGSYANTNWTITVDVSETSSAGTTAYEGQLFVVTTNGTTVTKVSQVGGLVTAAGPLAGGGAATLTITAPGVVTLAALQYLYLELYLKQTVSSGSTSGLTTVIEDDTGTFPSSILTPSFTAAGSGAPFDDDGYFIPLPNVRDDGVVVMVA